MVKKRERSLNRVRRKKKILGALTDFVPWVKKDRLTKIGHARSGMKIIDDNKSVVVSFRGTKVI